MSELFMLFLSLLIGGVITGNILGDMKQKTAEIVFFLWKGIQVFRKRVIPANPKSVAQTAHRLFFSQVLKLGQDINTSIIKPFWKHLAIKQSEFNAFMSWNLLSMSNGTDYSNLSLCRGSLYPTPITKSEYDSATGNLVFTWDPSLVGDQSATDKFYCAVYDKVFNAFFIDISGNAERSSGTSTLNLETGLTPSNLETYAWFSDKAITDPTFKASNSFYLQATAK